MSIKCCRRHNTFSCTRRLTDLHRVHEASETIALQKASSFPCQFHIGTFENDAIGKTIDFLKQLMSCVKEMSCDNGMWMYTYRLYKNLFCFIRFCRTQAKEKWEKWERNEKNIYMYRRETMKIDSWLLLLCLHFSRKEERDKIVYDRVIPTEWTYVASSVVFSRRWLRMSNNFLAVTGSFR